MAQKNNLSTKIILMVEAILLLSSILFCTVSIIRARNGIREAIQQRMLDIANCASGSVNGDILGSLTAEDVGSEEYNKQYNTLAIFRDNVELEYVYSIKEYENGKFIFTMDTDPDTPASFGDPVKYTEALAKAGKGTAAVDEVPYSDKWGEFYSAYSPVFDYRGKVAGIIAVDFSADWFDSQLSEQMRSTVKSYLIILLFSLLLAAGLSLITVSPFVRMQGELMEEKMRAESANLAKSDFLANMSHEIRTPINAVLGMNEMILRESRRTQEIKEGNEQAVRDSLKNIVVYAGDVENAGHNLLALVNDILDFSKIEAGRLDLVEAPYQLSSLLSDLSNMVQLKAQDKKLGFVIDVDKNLPDELNGDEVRVRQVLTNLLINAVKYTEFGSVGLTVKGEKHDDGILMLIADVKDTGIGIKKEDLEKLFTKFERLEMDRNSTVEGTGLGLTITKRLLDMMGGSISVESQYGSGSTFTVKIPQKIIKDVPMGDFQSRYEANVLEARAYKEAFHAPNAHILIVDDTRINLTVVSNLLKNTRIQIDTAVGGSEAVSKAKDIEYDIILMDQRMPEMDGIEALHKIRETENGKSSKVPVICLTADAVVGAKEKYLAEGFDDYISKPVDGFALEKMLMKYLPKEKVELVQDAKTEDIGERAAENQNTQNDDLNALRAAGIEPNIGLQYVQNDAQFYRSILGDYVDGEAEKKKLIQTCYAEEDWHNYMIQVHSLKSSSKMIGAIELSEMAAKQEQASKEGDTDTIRTGCAPMIRKYKEVADAIRSVIKAEAPAKQNEEILEFWPEK